MLRDAQQNMAKISLKLTDRNAKFEEYDLVILGGGVTQIGSTSHRRVSRRVR